MCTHLIPPLSNHPYNRSQPLPTPKPMHVLRFGDLPLAPQSNPTYTTSTFSSTAPPIQDVTSHALRASSRTSSQTLGCLAQLDLPRLPHSPHHHQSKPVPRPPIYSKSSSHVPPSVVMQRPPVHNSSSSHHHFSEQLPPAGKISNINGSSTGSARQQSKREKQGGVAGGSGRSVNDDVGMGLEAALEAHITSESPQAFTPSPENGDHAATSRSIVERTGNAPATAARRASLQKGSTKPEAVNHIHLKAVPKKPGSNQPDQQQPPYAANAGSSDSGAGRLLAGQYGSSEQAQGCKAARTHRQDDSDDGDGFAEELAASIERQIDRSCKGSSKKSGGTKDNGQNFQTQITNRAASHPAAAAAVAHARRF